MKKFIFFTIIFILMCPIISAESDYNLVPVNGQGTGNQYYNGLSVTSYQPAQGVIQKSGVTISEKRGYAMYNHTDAITNYNLFYVTGFTVTAASMDYNHIASSNPPPVSWRTSYYSNNAINKLEAGDWTARHNFLTQVIWSSSPSSMNVVLGTSPSSKICVDITDAINGNLNTTLMLKDTSLYDFSSPTVWSSSYYQTSRESKLMYNISWEYLQQCNGAYNWSMGNFNVGTKTECINETVWVNGDLNVSSTLILNNATILFTGRRYWDDLEKYPQIKLINISEKNRFFVDVEP